MSPNNAPSVLELAPPAVAVDTLDAAPRPTLEICSAAIGSIRTVASPREILASQTVLIESHGRPDGPVPVNRSNPVTYSYVEVTPGNPEDYPALDPDSVDTFNQAFDFILQLDPGTPINMEDLLRHLRKNGADIPNKPWAVAVLDTLVRGWEPEIAEYMELEGIRGKWGTLNGMPVFAPYQSDAAIQRIVQDGEKRKPTKKFLEEEARRAIWQYTDNTPSVAKPTTLESEDKLPANERVVLAYLSKLSVKNEVDYPSQDKVVDKILDASKRQNLSRDKVEQLIKNLVEQEFLFAYRSGGKPYVTTNANVAFEKRRQRREGGKDETKPKQEQKVDLDLSAELVEVLVGLGANKDKYTIHKLWAQLQLRNGVIVHHQKPTSEEMDAIKSTARSLADRGVFFATDDRAKFIVGFAQGQYRHFKDMDPAQRKPYLESLLEDKLTR